MYKKELIKTGLIDKLDTKSTPVYYPSTKSMFKITMELHEFTLI